MKKLQKLLSIGIAMTCMLFAITGCTSAPVDDTPATSTPVDTTTDTIEDEETASDVAESDTTSSDTTEAEQTEADTTEDEETSSDATASDIAESDTTSSETTEVDTTESDAMVSDITSSETTESESSDTVAVGFQQLAPPEAGDSIATITIAGFGEIKLKFFPDKAPLAVENFLTHAQSGYYDGIIFHRVINDFMIQGGDPTGTGMGGESIWGKAFDNEAHEDLFHFNGALSMANAGPDTNGSQFFIVKSSPVSAGSVSKYSDYAKENYTSLGGTPFLDGSYTVFGQVYEGLDVVQAVMNVKTQGSEMSSPVEAVVIESVVVSTY